jgi:hypothetical protein
VGEVSAGTAERRAKPVTLADQLIGWARWHAGDGITEIARVLGRRPRATRELLFGEVE